MNPRLRIFLFAALGTALAIVMGVEIANDSFALSLLVLGALLWATAEWVQGPLPEAWLLAWAIVEQLYPTAAVTVSGLRYVVRTPGTGPTPRPGSWVTANYAGRLLDGTPFDSSYQRGVPFTFRVGMGNVIKGWDEAFLTMKKGEKRTLIIPYWLGYGMAGSPPDIPPKATLIFEVEMLDFH